MAEVEYTITKFAEGQANKSPGVKAGMWAVVRTTKENFAFADTEDQAHTLLQELRKAQRNAAI